MREAQFETELIQYLSKGIIVDEISDDWNELSKEKAVRDAAPYIVEKKRWNYEPQIKTTEDLWQNFKVILEQHNQGTLDHPLSVVEFNQVKKIISNLHTPYVESAYAV